MKLHRFISNTRIKLGVLRIQDSEILNQFRNVLKLKVGERVIICDGRLNEGTGEIVSYGKDYIEINIKEIDINKNESERQVILYCSILKRENFELVVQKATEVGVKEIVPIISERTVKLDIRKERLEKIIKEAAEQSGRGIVPILHDPIDFEDAVKNIKKEGNNLLFDSSGSNFGNWKLEFGNYPLGVWIGPEGGWADKELELARQSNFQIVNLGKLTLRAETAVIVGLYMAIHS